MPKKRKRTQVTCYCGAYEFPHRIFGGHCNGIGWAASYFQHERDHCDGCSCSNGHTCEVVEGIEKATYCEGIKSHQQGPPDDYRHPLFGERLETYRSVNCQYSDDYDDAMVEDIPF